MGQMTIQLRDPWVDDNGTEYDPGTFLRVDDEVGDELIKLGSAIAKTPEEARAEEEERRAEQRKREQEERRRKARQTVINVRDRVADDPSGGYRSLGFFARDVALACKPGGRESQQLAAWSAATKTDVVEYDDSQGGYLIPPEYYNALMKTTLEDAVIEPRATYLPMQTNRIAVNAVVDEDHSTSLFGGINIQRPGEADAKTADKPTFRQVTLTLHKLTGLVAASDEIIEDSPISLEVLLTDLFGQAITFTKENDFINGTGINMALGVLNAGCLVTQAAEAGQPAATVLTENIVRMWSRLHPRSMTKAIWMCNPSVLPELYTMGLAVGTGGSAVFMPANGIAGSPYASLMGRPLIPTEHCQALGTTGDIILCDWSQYLIGGKATGGVKVASSAHIYFAYDKTAFRFVLRYDGQPWWRAALTPEHGGATATLSPFVALATR